MVRIRDSLFCLFKKNLFLTSLRPLFATLNILLFVFLLFPINLYAETEETAVTTFTPPTVKRVSFQKLKEFKSTLEAYNKKEYLMAYNVFLMNGNVDYAYIIAQSAVDQRPKSLFWRKRLAQSALWAGYSEVALKQYLYFVENNIEFDTYYELGLKLASQINDFDTQEYFVRTKMSRQPNDKSLILNYAFILQNQGFPDKALAFLEGIPHYDKDVAYLKELVKITMGLDNQTLALKYAKALWLLDKHANSSMQYARLLYFNNNISEAFEVYNKSTHSQGITAEYWQNYAAVALLAGKDYPAITAYKQLLASNAIDKQNLFLLINLERNSGQEGDAYQDAKVAYQRYGYPDLIPVIISLGEQLKKWKDIHAFINKIPPNELAKLEEKPRFAMLLITISDELNLDWETHRLWQWVFQRWPNLTLTQRAYLWYLLDNHDLVQLRYTLSRWRRILATKKSLWLPYMAGLMTLGNYPKALNVLLDHSPEIKKSYDLMANLADLYNQTDHYYAGHYMARRALSRLTSIVNKHPQKLTIKQQLRLTELVQAVAPASVVYNLVLVLSKQLFTSNEIDNQIISWALNKQRYDLARYISNVHLLTDQDTPSWMTLTLALLYYDQPTMALLLRDKAETLPYRDRVTAATLTGNAPLAQNYAYKGLKDHPNDEEMYKLFTSTMLPFASHFITGLEDYAYGVVEGPVSYTKLRLFITPSLSVNPYEILWSRKSLNAEQLVNVPKIDNSTGLSIRKYTRRGWASVTLGGRKSLESFATLKFKVQHQINSANIAQLRLGINQQAPETTAMLVGGMKNEAQLTITSRIDSYNTFDAGLKLQQYRGQDNSRLGSGEILQAHIQHKFYLNYPDWNINFYSTGANFKKSSNPLSYKLSTLVPANTLANTTFYMPVSYVDAAITVGVGQQFAKGYTHDWKTYGEAGYIYSIPFGLGGIVEGGIGGSVFGRDHLSFYGQYSFNQQQADQKNYLVGIRYDNYF